MRLAAGCGQVGGNGSSDSGTDSDADADVDSDTDTDTDSDTGTGTVSPPDLPWVTIPGGVFQMGSTEGDLDELPVHEVDVPSFEMTRTEVTVAQYGDCVEASICGEPGTGAFGNWSSGPGCGTQPVNMVDWSQAAAFCAWVGARLPSEAEWEYAARSGGQEITYPWGEETPSCDYAVMDEGEGSCGDEGTMEVCSKPAGNTEQGLCDMAGNLHEWVRDWYHPDYTGAPTDGSAWEEPAGSYRVYRGGSFGNDFPYHLRAAFRHELDPAGSPPSVGFRCARSP